MPPAPPRPPAPRTRPLFRGDAARSRFGSSLATSLALHATALGCGLLVAFGAATGVRASGPEALVMLADAEPDTSWQLETAPSEPESQLELPAEPEVELVPVELPDEPFEQVFAPDAEPEPLPLDRFAFSSSSALPLRRREPRPPQEETRAVAASAPAAATAPRGEDRPLRLLEGPTPEYPHIALRLQQQGSVLLEIEVAADGRVSAVRVLESSGVERLDEAAREGVLVWRFEPELADGRPVVGTFRHRIEFRLN